MFKRVHLNTSIDTSVVTVCLVLQPEVSFYRQDVRESVDEVL